MRRQIDSTFTEKQMRLSWVVKNANHSPNVLQNLIFNISKPISLLCTNEVAFNTAFCEAVSEIKSSVKSILIFQGTAMNQRFSSLIEHTTESAKISIARKVWIEYVFTILKYFPTGCRYHQTFNRGTHRGKYYSEAVFSLLNTLILKKGSLTGRILISLVSYNYIGYSNCSFRRNCLAK